MDEAEIRMRSKVARAALGEEIQDYFAEHQDSCRALRGGSCTNPCLLVFISRTKIAGIGPDLSAQVMRRH